MSAATLSPPRPLVCLTKSYLSREVKGGTVIAEDVTTLSRHNEHVVDPDSYRPFVTPCRGCGCGSVHAHCFRDRRLRPARRDGPVQIVTVRLFRCASCRAVFTVLPAFVARHLWRAWKTIEEVSKSKLEAPRSTARRWLSRLRSDARQLVGLFASSVEALAGEFFKRGWQSRHAFVEALCALFDRGSERFAFTAAWIHRLAAGIRLM